MNGKERGERERESEELKKWGWGEKRGLCFFNKIGIGKGNMREREWKRELIRGRRVQLA